MNRRALKTLLRSGRFLCFDARAVYLDLKEGLPPDEPPKDKLFELSTLNLGIFFKEVTLDDQEDEVLVSTRVYFPYNDEEVDQGGESTSADPDRIVRVLAKRGAIRADESLSAHDQKVLDILTTMPTFDPFLLLSQRRELEVERAISPNYFEISEADWMLIRRPVLEKIGILVSKANRKNSLDVYKEYVGETNKEDEENRLMTGAVVDAIWQGEDSEGARSLIRSFRLDVGQTKQFLFAWKGINYYEFQYSKYQDLFYSFFEWLGSANSLPRDGDTLPDSAMERFKFRRNRARTLIRSTHATLIRILRHYNEAFDRLIKEDDPIPFQAFLREAPQNFLTVGLAIGVLAHTANAWSNVTGKKRRALKSFDLEPFYDFIIAINGQDFQVQK